MPPAAARVPRPPALCGNGCETCPSPSGSNPNRRPNRAKPGAGAPGLPRIALPQHCAAAPAGAPGGQHLAPRPARAGPPAAAAGAPRCLPTAPTPNRAPATGPAWAVRAAGSPVSSCSAASTTNTGWRQAPSTAAQWRPSTRGRPGSRGKGTRPGSPSARAARAASAPRGLSGSSRGRSRASAKAGATCACRPATAAAGPAASSTREGGPADKAIASAGVAEAVENVMVVCTPGPARFYHRSPPTRPRPP
jgi:hypothetical protein